MSVNPDPDSLAVLHGFLLRFAEDRASGNQRPLSAYQALFPGHETTVARKHAEITSSPTPDSGVPTTGRGHPESLGRYRIVRELGRGGQGVVYLAEDQQLHRRVALKVLNLVLDPDGVVLARFHREAEAASKLNHPGICAIHDAGEHEGLPFIAMQYVEGESLAQKINDARGNAEGVCCDVVSRPGNEPDAGQPEPTRNDRHSTGRKRVNRVIRLIESTARAIHHAHETGVIHRDLKPANIMVTAQGEPVVLDFGLARDLESDVPSLTSSGDVFGSPSYMSPEQVQPDRGRPDRRTDVYSMGVTLFECLTLRLPFQAPTREGLYRQILLHEPSAVSLLNPSISKDLHIVVQTALEKDRDRRYQTALDFAEDLRRVREQEPIRARAPSKWLRLRRWSQRNPALATSTLALLVILSAGLAISLAVNAKMKEALRERRADALADASVEVQQRDGRLALLLARKAFETREKPKTVSQLHAALATMYEYALLDGHSAYVEGAVFSPDGEHVLTFSGDGTARLWDLAGRELEVFEHPQKGATRNYIKDACFSPDGTRIATASQNGTVRIWSINGDPVGEFEHGEAVFGVVYSPDGKLILTTSTDQTARLSDSDGNEVQTLAGHESTVWSGAFSQSGQYIVTTSADWTAKVWRRVEPEGSRWEWMSTLSGHTAWVWSACFRKDEDAVLTVSSGGGLSGSRGDRTARLWNLSGEPLGVFPHEDQVWSAEFSADGDRVLTASGDGSIGLWGVDGEGNTVHEQVVIDRSRNFQSARFAPGGGDLFGVTGGSGYAAIFHNSGRQIAALRGHSGWVPSSAFSPDGRLFLTAGHDRTARLWRLSWPELPFLYGHGAGVTSVAISGEGLIATASLDGTVRIWDAQGDLRRVLGDPDGQTRFAHVAFSPDRDQVVASKRKDGVVRWSLDGEVLPKLDLPEDLMLTSVFSPTRPQILVAGEKGVYLCGLDGQLLQTFGSEMGAQNPDSQRASVERRGAMQSASFSPDGDRVVTASWDRTARVWTLQGELIEKLPHLDRVNDATFSPRGDLVLTACDDGKAYLWDLEGVRQGDGSLEQEQVFHGHEGRVISAVFSPSQMRVLTASEDSTARIWHLDGSVEAVLRGHRGEVTAVACTPSGDRIFTASADGTVRSWPLGREELVRLVGKQLEVWELTPEERERYADLLGQ